MFFFFGQQRLEVQRRGLPNSPCPTTCAASSRPAAPILSNLNLRILSRGIFEHGHLYNMFRFS